MASGLIGTTVSVGLLAAAEHQARAAEARSVVVEPVRIAGTAIDLFGAESPLDWCLSGDGRYLARIPDRRGHKVDLVIRDVTNGLDAAWKPPRSLIQDDTLASIDPDAHPLPSGPATRSWRSPATTDACASSIRRAPRSAARSEFPRHPSS
jgi:hypothetical protein